MTNEFGEKAESRKLKISGWRGNDSGGITSAQEQIPGYEPHLSRQGQGR